MSEELIRRSDAIKAIEELPNAYNGWSDAYDKAYIIGTLEEVPSADRPQEWIPCSERLPEEKEVVAVIIKQWDTGETKKGITYRVDRNMWVGFGRYNEACVWWLPLPPWKGADDE